MISFEALIIEPRPLERLKRGIFINIRCVIHNCFINIPTLQLKPTCNTEVNNISRVFVTKAPENNWIIQIKHKIPCIFLDFSYSRFGSVLPRRARLRIYQDNSKLSEESLEKYLLEVFMIIRAQCQWEYIQFNESPKSIPICE